MLPNAENWNRENAIGLESRISNALRQLSLEELSNHKLLGLASSRGWLEEKYVEAGRERLHENLKRESVAARLMGELGSELFATAGRSALAMPVGLLKGAALRGDLYRAGEREASDIDLFIDEKDEETLLKILERLSFSEQVRSKERASNFKTVCLSERYGDLSVEVHTRLWWREPKGFAWVWRPSLRAPFMRLSPEDQLLHLCG